MSDSEETPPFEPTAHRPKPAFDYEQIKGLVQKFFKVYEAEENLGSPGSEISAFYVQADSAQFNQRFESLREEIRRIDANLMVILQYRGGEDIILVARKPPVLSRGQGLNLFLFIATIITTTMAGALSYAWYEQAKGLVTLAGVDITALHPKYLALGLVGFSLPIMLILGIHELGHYYVARRHHVRTSLPFFIPVPPLVPIGTFGAFIQIRDPIPDRKALFDIGAAGPIAGFVATLPILAIGLFLTAAVAAPVPPEDEVHGVLIAPDGTVSTLEEPAYAWVVAETVHTRNDKIYRERFVVNSTAGQAGASNWTFRVAASYLEKDTSANVRVTFVAPGNATPPEPFRRTGGDNYTADFGKRTVGPSAAAVFAFALPAEATNLTAEFDWDKPASRIMHLGTSLLFQGFAILIPTSSDVLIHPTGFAGWVGLLVTGFNLLPAGQLDGGHVARAVLGEGMRWASWGSILVLAALSYFFAGWLLMAVLILFLGINHPPPLNDKVPLDPRRRILAFLVLLILGITFIPIPFSS